MQKTIMKNSDIWSLGWVIYELSALRPPFIADNQLALAMKIKSGKVDDLPEQYSHDLQKNNKNDVEIRARWETINWTTS